MEFLTSDNSNDLIIAKVSLPNTDYESIYNVAYDVANSTLHILDDRKENIGTSIINIISVPFIEDIAKLMNINTAVDKLAIIVYQSELIESGGIVFKADFSKPDTESPLSAPLTRSEVLILGYEPFYKVIYRD